MSFQNKMGQALSDFKEDTYQERLQLNSADKVIVQHAIDTDSE